MSLNLLQKRIIHIQLEYKELLCTLLPILETGYSHQALDEINIFWHRRVDIVQLYLNYYVSYKDSYAFTASTFMDYDDGEHLPFLLIGDLHTAKLWLWSVVKSSSKINHRKFVFGII